MMPDFSRRALLKQSAFGTLAAITTKADAAVGIHERIASHPLELRPRPIEVAGFHAYGDRHSVRAGERLQIHVSSTLPYRLQICQLGAAIDDRTKDDVIHHFPDKKEVAQNIHPGSCALIDRGLPLDFLQSPFAIEIWIRPFLTAEPQAILTQDSSLGSFGLALTANKEVFVRLGEETVLQSPPLTNLGEMTPVPFSWSIFMKGYKP